MFGCDYPMHLRKKSTETLTTPSSPTTSIMTTALLHQHYFTIIWIITLLLRLGNAQVQIETSSGVVRGVLKNFDGEQYREFLGIPYAEQPRRFSPSVPKSPWNGTLNAMQHGPSCPQDVAEIKEIYDGRDYLFKVPDSANNISEDCLTLNVYTPGEFNPAGGSEKYAVMVWIHGGDFQVGQGSAYNGAVLATRGTVVVVTFNFRLGPFGFLTTLDEHSTGNYALLDQQLVLRWIQSDISRFGGDPNRVTLFGQSTGGISASLHLFAPGSQELFQRVIAESSVALPWNLDEGFREPVDAAVEFASHAGCGDFKSNSELMKCLRGSELQTLVDAWRMVKYDPWRSTWAPVIDGEFLPVPSTDYSATDTYMAMDHDILIGVNTLEGSPRQIAGVNGISRDLTSGLSKKSWNRLLNSILADFGDQRDLVASSVNQLYTDWNMYGDDLSRLQPALNLIGDMNSVVKVYEFLTSWISGGESGNAFMYVFDHKTEFYSSDDLSGAFHAEELPYVWGAPFSNELMGYFTEDEEELSDTIMMYWTNFAKSGNPSQSPDQQAAANAINDLPIWPKYNTNDMPFMYLSATNGTNGDNSVSARQRYRWQQIYFWTETLPNLLEYSTCNIDECKVGENDGWNLTSAQAVFLLNFLIGLCIFLVVVVMMTCAMACGYREAVKMAQYGSPKGKWGYLPKHTSASTLQRETSDLWRLNCAFEPDEDDTRL